MMAHNKHLHELLQEDQEPFLLENYISDRKSQLQIVPKSSVSKAEKQKPITHSSISKRSLYKQSCFFSFQNSPDLRKSPPKSSNAAVSLHIPSRTAALLLESALRIQKQLSARKPRTQISNLGLGLLGSIFKRLSSEKQTRNREIGNVGARREKGKKLNGNVEMGFSCSCNDDDKSTFRRNSGVWSGGKSDGIGKGEKIKGNNVIRVEDGSPVEMGLFSCDCNTSRRTSTIWSEEKSLDLESSSSTSSRSYDFEEERENGDYGFCENGFSSSPMSPFRFALETTHSFGFGGRTPVFVSPATSPTRNQKQERETCEVLLESMVEEEEEKEQFSPVSVLDPPFEDDDYDCNEEGTYDLECSYAFVQRAKQQLMHKLRRFEKLAELDPIELEKMLSEEQDDGYVNIEDAYDEELDEAESLLSCTEKNADDFVREVLGKLGFQFSEVPAHVERLVLDLIAEEKREDNGELVVKRVCKRLDVWKDEKPNTIDKMVGLDCSRGSGDGWNRTDENQVREAAMEIEQSIFTFLVEELSEELMEFGGESS